MSPLINNSTENNQFQQQMNVNIKNQGYDTHSSSDPLTDKRSLSQ